MDEQQWRETTDPRLMLEYLHGKGSDRNRRLFTCACCRLVWHLLSERCRAIVEAEERYADKQATLAEMQELFRDWPPSHDAATHLPGGAQAALAVRQLGAFRDPDTYCVSRSAAEALAKTIPWREARRQQGLLLHDLFGNPFSAPVLQPGWLVWNEALVVRLAQAAYDSREGEDGRFDPARLAVLADALEEAGCGDAAVLDHLRGPGPHYRGCFVLDAILAKE